MSITIKVNNVYNVYNVNNGAAGAARVNKSLTKIQCSEKNNFLPISPTKFYTSRVTLNEHDLNLLNEKFNGKFPRCACRVK